MIEGFSARAMWFSLCFQKITLAFAWTVDKERSKRAGREPDGESRGRCGKKLPCIPMTWREF